MRMNWKEKVTGGLLVLTMILTVFSGCSEKKSDDKNEEKTVVSSEDTGDKNLPAASKSAEEETTAKARPDEESKDNGAAGVQEKQEEATPLPKKRKKTAGEAYAEAARTGLMPYRPYYQVADVNHDGVKDLLLLSEKYTIYSYKKGKVKKILTYEPYGVVIYDKKKGIFWDEGEYGDGRSQIMLKKKGKKLVEVCSYSFTLGSGYSYRAGGKDAKEVSITKEEYEKAGSSDEKTYIDIINRGDGMTKERWIRRLEKLK